MSRGQLCLVPPTGNRHWESLRQLVQFFFRLFSASLNKCRGAPIVGEDEVKDKHGVSVLDKR